MSKPKRPAKEYHLNSTLDFGKYKGRTVREVLEIDPAYLAWAVEEISSFKLDSASMAKLDSAIDDEAPFDSLDYMDCF